jgi:MFS family permease
MTQPTSLTRGRLRTPRAAAIAGILFSGLLIAAFLLFLSAVPRDSLEHGTWLATGLDRVVLAINLIPFAGVAFLWFIGVVRDRLAEAEDRLFATVFLGSGLIFLVLMFVATAVFGAIVLVHAAHPEALRDSPAFALARAFAYTLVNVYAIRMAGVFMLITSTIALRTAFIARWMAAPGFAMGLFLLFASQWVDWSFIVFPVWALLISVYLLVTSLAQEADGRRKARSVP